MSIVPHALSKKGLVMDKAFETEDVVILVSDPETGVIVMYRKSDDIIGWVRARTLDGKEGTHQVTWTTQSYAHQHLCALRAPFFAYDISGSHLGSSANCTFRVIHLFDDRIVSDHTLPELCPAICFDTRLNVWTCDVAGKVFCHKIESSPTLLQQLLPHGQQPVALCSMPCPTEAEGYVCVLTQSHLHVLHSAGGEVSSYPLPDDIQKPPPEITIEIDLSEAKEGQMQNVPLPSLDSVDHVFTVRCLSNVIVVMLQNSMLVSQPPDTPGGNGWIHIQNFAGVMDAVDVDPVHKLVAFSHVSGDVFALNPHESDLNPIVMTPRRDRVMGRKEGYSSHMLCTATVDGQTIVFASRPEGMVDAAALQYSS